MNPKKKEETQLIISLPEDNSSIYSYDQRVLDALASIFNIQSTCAAIALHTATNKFLLSYNEKCTGVTEKKLQDLLTLIKKSLQAEHQSKEAKCQLVALYIIFNGEFYPRIRDFGEQEDLKEDTFNLLNLLSTEIEQAKKDLNTYCYNLEMLQQEFKQKTALLPKANTIEEIELIQNKLHAECEEFKHNIEHKESKLNQVFNRYKALFKNLKKYSAPNLQEYNETKLTNTEIELNKIVFRPWQDIIKAIRWLKQKEYKSIQLEILPNDKNLHAESNIAFFFKPFRNKKDPLYIGISKLCCILCDKVLNDEQINHRGHHGMLFFGWVPPFEKYKSLEQQLRKDSKKTKQKQAQHRKLSIDEEFETGLPEFCSLKEFFNLTNAQDTIEFIVHPEERQDLTGSDEIKAGGGTDIPAVITGEETSTTTEDLG